MEPDRLRFDFTHGKPIDQVQIREIEDWINTTALQSIRPVIKEYPLQKAIDMGSIAVFSEKYGEVVRVVDFPKVTMELCGGTHVEDLSRIYPFKILSEGSVAAGICTGRCPLSEIIVPVLPMLTIFALASR